MNRLPLLVFLILMVSCDRKKVVNNISHPTVAPTQSDKTPSEVEPNEESVKAPSEPVVVSPMGERTGSGGDAVVCRKRLNNGELGEIQSVWSWDYVAHVSSGLPIKLNQSGNEFKILARIQDRLRKLDDQIVLKGNMIETLQKTFETGKKPADDDSYLNFDRIDFLNRDENIQKTKRLSNILDSDVFLEVSDLCQNGEVGTWGQVARQVNYSISESILQVDYDLYERMDKLNRAIFLNHELLIWGFERSNLPLKNSQTDDIIDLNGKIIADYFQGDKYAYRREFLEGRNLAVAFNSPFKDIKIQETYPLVAANEKVSENKDFIKYFRFHSPGSITHSFVGSNTSLEGDIFHMSLHSHQAKTGETLFVGVLGEGSVSIDYPVNGENPYESSEYTQFMISGENLSSKFSPYHERRAGGNGYKVDYINKEFHMVTFDQVQESFDLQINGSKLTVPAKAKVSFSKDATLADASFVIPSSIEFNLDRERKDQKNYDFGTIDFLHELKATDDENCQSIYVVSPVALNSKDSPELYEIQMDFVRNVQVLDGERVDVDSEYSCKELKKLAGNSSLVKWKKYSGYVLDWLETEYY